MKTRTTPAECARPRAQQSKSTPGPTFALVLEGGRAAAAIVPWAISDKQLAVILHLVPNAYYQHELTHRWNLSDARVLSTDDWASEQKRRRPMFKPKTITLVFL